jgi:hypothetical protein
MAIVLHPLHLLHLLHLFTTASTTAISSATVISDIGRGVIGGQDKTS